MEIRKQVVDVKAVRGAEIGSDHYLVLTYDSEVEVTSEEEELWQTSDPAYLN